LLVVTGVLLLSVLLAACSGSTVTVTTTQTGTPTSGAGGSPTSGTATATTSSAPTATSAPITSCAQVSGFGSAGAVSAGAHFSEIGFPAHTVGYIQQTFEDNSFQFRLLNACTSGTSASTIRAYFSSGLPSTGFAQSATYPYHGNASSGCGDPYCWYKGTAHPSFQASRYVSLESVSTVGGVVTYTLRLCITPLVFNNIIIKGTNMYDFDLVDQPDVFWEQVTTTVRTMDPLNGATLANIGVTNFANVTYAQLTGLALSGASIDGNNDSTNKLVNGDVWAVHTDSGHYVKVLVVTYSNNIVVNYVLYDFTF